MLADYTGKVTEVPFERKIVVRRTQIVNVNETLSLQRPAPIAISAKICTFKNIRENAFYQHEYWTLVTSCTDSCRAACGRAASC